MPRPIAIVTGSNKGIGLATVKQLLKEGVYDVYLTSRDPVLGAAAVESLAEFGKALYHQLDVTSDESVQRFVAHLHSAHPEGIALLVNNAGMAYKLDDFGEAPARVTLATNYFGLKRVFHALLPLMTRGARIINVASMAGMLRIFQSPQIIGRWSAGDITEQQIDDLCEEFVVAVRDGKNEELGWGKTMYGLSKVAVNAFSYAASRMPSVVEREIIVNSVCPGYVRTDMTSERAMLTPEQGAAHVLAAPHNPDQPGPSGLFFSSGNIVDWRATVDRNAAAVMSRMTANRTATSD